MKPKPHVNTSKKGWMDNPDNVRYDEQVIISRQIRNKDMNAQVILDLSNKRIERNAFNTDKEFDEVFEYFFTNYNQYIVEVMGQLDPGYLAEVVERMQSKLDSDSAPIEVEHEEVKAE
jgi:hypothetical protein